MSGCIINLASRLQQDSLACRKACFENFEFFIWEMLQQIQIRQSLETIRTFVSSFLTPIPHFQRLPLIPGQNDYSSRTSYISGRIFSAVHIAQSRSV